MKIKKIIRYSVIVIMALCAMMMVYGVFKGEFFDKIFRATQVSKQIFCVCSAYIFAEFATKIKIKSYWKRLCIYVVLSVALTILAFVANNILHYMKICVRFYEMPFYRIILADIHTPLISCWERYVPFTALSFVACVLYDKFTVEMLTKGFNYISSMIKKRVKFVSGIRVVLPDDINE